jgi:excisionase family DNA binding protein
MDTHRDTTTGYRGWQHAGPQAVPHPEVGRLLAHLEQRLAELDRLHREIAQDAQALAHAAAATPERRDGAAGRSVYSIRAAATELGVSVSMLHKLLKQRRLGHLKVGARTLITAEHLAQFREASEVAAPETSPEPAASGTAKSSSIQQPHPTSSGGCLSGLGGCVVSRGEPIGRTANGRSSIHKGDDGSWHGYVSMGNTDAARRSGGMCEDAPALKSPRRWRRWGPNAPAQGIDPARTSS